MKQKMETLCDPISLDVLTNPVVVKCCGHTFSREPLRTWLKGIKNNNNLNNTQNSKQKQKQNKTKQNNKTKQTNKTKQKQNKTTKQNKTKQNK